MNDQTNHDDTASLEHAVASIKRTAAILDDLDREAAEHYRMTRGDLDDSIEAISARTDQLVRLLDAPDADERPLDFSALLAARSRVLDLVSRLEHGDTSATVEARRLLDASEQRCETAARALSTAGVTEIQAIDAVCVLVNALGYGELLAALDVAEGHDSALEAQECLERLNA